MAEGKELKSILATDCGSTTTKAILIEKTEEGYRLKVRGEAPTTVEAPFEDVTKGALNAIMEVEELAGRKLLNDEGQIITPQTGDEGADIYISTSSAGGGLQMMVAGVVKNMTGESAQRAALGAGAIVMDILATNDGRLPHERIERIRQLRPDMILLSGGTDGGTISKVVELAELISAASPKARLGAQYSLPIIYAGNKDAQGAVEAILAEMAALSIVPNLRPVLERENLKPARDEIHELFMEHVMAHAPGYKKLMVWTAVPIMPTPGAVGLIMRTIATLQDISVVGVDIGGATTDVFSVWWPVDEETKEKKEVFNRTVSANLGMSYSISNVFAEAGMENVMRWMPFKMDERDLRNRIRNKMIRPTTIPQSLKELVMEQAIAREALRLAFKQHKELAVGLKGVQQARTISDTFEQTTSGETLVNMMDLDLLVGSGGVLSHAPRRCQSAMMMIDAFVPEGITKIAVDSIFMMPQLGVLSSVGDGEEESSKEYSKSAKVAAVEVFNKDCMVKLGTCIAPSGQTKKDGDKCLKFTLKMPDGSTRTEEIAYGNVLVIPLGIGEFVEATLEPARNFDLGEGNGKPVICKLEGGIVGLMFDCRGRPLVIPTDEVKRVASLQKWLKAIDMYPPILEE